jgi:ergothioneine biosynthesis protein EgtB
VTPVPSNLREALALRLTAAREWTDSLFDVLTPAGLFERPISERHRLIFYLGHLEAFDWNLLCRDANGAPSRNPEFERLFAFGIDPVDGNVPTDRPDEWPSPAQVRSWNALARADVDRVIRAAPLTGWLDHGWAIHLALEHRLMHAETLTYLLQRLEVQFKQPGPLPPGAPAPAPNRSIVIPGGTATLGLSRASAPHLGWDNEYERHHLEAPPFAIDRRPVSNDDWLAFVEAGGYDTRAWWTEADWAWRSRDDITHPAFWRRREGRWFWKAMFGEVPLPGGWPVYVSHAEASAYARWKNARLPTEAQWHRASQGIDSRALRIAGHGHFGGVRFDPAPIDSFPGGVSSFGVSELIGNGWEWTSTPFSPFVGFEPLPFYPGYSANFFDGRHFVLKGASVSTAADFLRPSFRNWFQPHYQHVFATFRLVRDA